MNGAIQDPHPHRRRRRGRGNCWINLEVTQHVEETYRQEKRGRPGANTRYRRRTRTHHRIAWHVTETLVTHDAASDDCFPLITNDTVMTPAEVLAAYRYQPNRLGPFEQVVPAFQRISDVEQEN